MNVSEYLKTFFSSNKHNREFLFHVIYSNMKKSRNKYIKNIKRFSDPFDKREYERILDLNRVCDYDLFIESRNEKYNTEFDKFINAHVLIITNELSKELFSNMIFCNTIYDRFLVDYLKVNKNFVKENITNHIDLAALIEPLFTGLISYLHSESYSDLYSTHKYRCFKECNSKIKFHGSFMKHAYKVFTISDIIAENNVLNRVHPSECININDYNENFLKIVFKEAMLNILFATILCIVDNYEIYDVLKSIVHDCEMSMVSNSKINNYVNKELGAIVTKLTILKNEYDTNEKYSTKFSNIIEPQIMKYASNNQMLLSTIKNIVNTYPCVKIDSPDWDISKEQFYELVVNSGLLEYIKTNAKLVEDKFTRFYNYSISQHFRDIVKYDPLYILFMDEGINIKTLEAK